MDVEMEDEAPPHSSHDPSSSSSSSSTSKRLGLRSTIQTNFGDDYVFQIASGPETSSLAVSLSSNIIKLYSLESGQFLGECNGHSGTINEISFALPSSPSVLCSCSSDATVRAWDTRTFKQVSLLRAGPMKEIFSFCIGGSSGNLLAAGSNAEIHFWDWRNGKTVACLEECHMDDVTQVRFVPHQQNKLVSASVDGLMCLFDTDGHIDDDSHLNLVMNAGSSIGKIGFFGNMNNKLWCLTHTETLSLWDWGEARREIIFRNTRSLASDKCNLDLIDYFVDCYYYEADDQLWLIGGNSCGTLAYFPVDTKASGVIGYAEAILEGGHSEVVRTILPASCTGGGLASKGIFGWTGGEDGRLCCWSSPKSMEANQLWLSSSLVIKSQKFRKMNRHHPY